MTTPNRSRQQRLDALERAQIVRRHRRDLKRDLGDGRIRLADVLLEPVADLDRSMKIIDALVALPKIGRIKALKALERAHVSPAKTLGGMTADQRRRLLARLADTAPGSSSRQITLSSTKGNTR